MLSDRMRRSLCQVASYCSLQPGQTVCRQGEAADAFYVLISGSVQVFVDDRLVDGRRLCSRGCRIRGAPAPCGQAPCDRACGRGPEVCGSCDRLCRLTYGDRGALCRVRSLSVKDPRLSGGPPAKVAWKIDA